MDQQEQPRLQPTRGLVLGTLGIVAALTVAVLIGYRYGITLWDWIKLLIVPAVIAGGGLWFNAQQRAREQQIANECAQDEALQAYLDQMSDLLIPAKDQPSSYDEHPPDSLRSVVRARTLTVLPRLDGDRKARVLPFLYEAGLIAKSRPVLALDGADLRRANLRGANVNRVLLGEANLREANLIGADLIGANLWHTDLRFANLEGTNLSEAHLIAANLIGTLLSGANLSAANLTASDLSPTDLRESVLVGAQGWTEKQLPAAKWLEGATMPNGQKYEEWLESKGSEEDANNGGSS